MDAVHFEPRASGVEVADMESVAVAKLGGEESSAVIIDHHRPIDDLIATIGVDVGDAQTVVSLAGELRETLACVKHPPRPQLTIPPVPGRHD